MSGDFTPRERQEIVAMWEIHARHKGAACKPVGSWLVQQMKRTWPRFAGWRGPHKTNSKRSCTLISYHHPAQLCWLWSVWFTAFPTDGKWGLRWGGYRGNSWFAVKYLFRVSIHRQPHYSWMLSSNAKLRLASIVEAHLEDQSDAA